MKLAVVLASVVLLLSACASSSHDAGAAVPQPKVSILQTSTMPVLAEHITGGMSVSLRMSVTNQATIPITLKRAEIQSVGEGGWDLRATQREFDRTIPPGATESFDLWVEAEAGQSVAGTNAPVTVRVMTIYGSDAGTFTNTLMTHIGGQIQ